MKTETTNASAPACAHTPTPWKIRHAEGLHDQAPFEVRSDHETIVARCGFTGAAEVIHRETAAANAELIVRAVNSHAELLAVAKTFLAMGAGTLSTADLLEGYKAARAAIAKAEGRA